MKMRLAALAAVSFVVAWVATLALNTDTAESQGLPPDVRAIIFQGYVSIAGQPAPAGLKVTARIAPGYESPATNVRAAGPGRYSGLQVGPAREYEGRTIEFWLEGQVKAQETAFFGVTQANGQPCAGCGWSLPFIRDLDLNFDSAPIPTPSPTLTPTPTRFVLQPSFYSGRIIAGDSVPPDGTEIFARIEDYSTGAVKVTNGRFSLVVNPVDSKYLAKPLQFLIGNVAALQAVQYQPGQFREDLNLIFPPIPTPTPTPTATPTQTPTPTPTFTPEPTRTSTPTLTPTVTPTFTSTPTPLPDLTATAVAVKEAQGGGCRSGGSASAGMIGLLMLPFGLAIWRQRMRDTRRS